MTEEQTASNGCIPKILNPIRNIFTSFNGHQVHPLEPIGPKDCDFILINSKIHLRVLHVNPDNLRRSFLFSLNNSEVYTSKRSSLAEEYWFTKWNKPLKIGNCNCSFRRSIRFSVISTQPSIQEKSVSTKSTFDLPPTKIVNAETFVERLIQETFFEAFQEYYMITTNNQSLGTINLAYESTEDDCLVNLRKKCKNEEKTKRPSCAHKKQQKKPLVFLLHGIGSSADVWWIVINSLVHKGYEIVAPDMLGHGFSSAPDKAAYYTFQNLLLQSLTIFDRYMTNNEKRKCIIIAHSYGCSLATAMYQHRPAHISQLVLISGGGPTPLAAPVSEDEISPFGCMYNLLRPLLFCGVKRSLFYSSRGKYFNVCNKDCAVPNHVLKFIQNGQHWPHGDAAYHRRILVPTLLVHGLQDKFVTLVQECEMERTIPRAFLELIPNAGHMAMIETPEHLIHMIICFLDCWS